ncbi:MAG: 2-amino-4-hydroxy-6-hydroxymethyldihydropteridine diphosphokinase [Gammaproteobacteria bacterium]
MSFHSNIIKAKLTDISALDGQPLAYIGIGSNLGSDSTNPQQILEQAFEALKSLSASPIGVSSLWESQPIDCPPGSPLFINAVAVLAPRISDPLTLLRALQDIELEFGRLRTGQRNAPRTLDLDLLSYGETVRSDEVLTLPHPRLHQRAFVVFPLLEISPDYRVPGTLLRLSELAHSLAEQGLRKVGNNA